MMSGALLEVVSALARSLGQEHADSIARDHAQKLGFRVESVTRQQALDLLEDIAAQPGIVGITARFAKARMHITTK
jgi:hypothetical protein